MFYLTPLGLDLPAPPLPLCELFFLPSPPPLLLHVLRLARSACGLIFSPIGRDFPKSVRYAGPGTLASSFEVEILTLKFQTFGIALWKRSENCRSMSLLEIRVISLTVDTVCTTLVIFVKSRLAKVDDSMAKEMGRRACFILQEVADKARNVSTRPEHELVLMVMVGK